MRVKYVTLLIVERNVPVKLLALTSSQENDLFCSKSGCQLPLKIYGHSFNQHTKYLLQITIVIY